ncbi:MAG: shikimate dehydrogenase [Leptospiraceae bacterium]|nr:shikimate dehydrogenase [Leptospiraceae bacterium]
MKAHSPSNVTKILGILGNPLSHTLSPTIHNQFYQDLNLDCIYLVFDHKNPTKQDLLTLHSYGLRGLSVTIPYKEWAYEIADERDSYSNLMKASNTLVFHEGKIFSYNTDGLGAVSAIRRDQPQILESQEEHSILICGSGGSARGISFAIIEEWAEAKKSGKASQAKQIYILSRNEDTSNQLMNDLNLRLNGSAKVITLSNLYSIQNSIQLIIHTTPLGMLGKEQISFLPSDFILPSMTVFDIVYNPKETILIQDSKSKGASVIYGIEMLLYQAIRQHELFTNTSPTDEMIDKVRNKLYTKLNS